MGKTTHKPIGTFAEFIKEKKTKLPIKENNEISLDVPFYNEAIGTVLNDLHNVAGNPINWDILLDYLKVKYLIIDRELPGDELMVSAHIKDLLFQYYGQSMVCADVNLSYNSAEVGAKTLVLSQLADDILRKVRVEAGLEMEAEPECDPKPIATVSLDNDDYIDDDCYYGESKVIGFEKFSSMLKESVSKITCENDDKCLDYCLNELQTKAGSLKLDDVLKVAQEAEYSTLEGYISSIVEYYLNENEIELNGTKLQNNERQGTVLNQARKVFAYQVVAEVMAKINKETLKK